MSGEELPKGWALASFSQVFGRFQYGYTASASPELSGPRFLRITDIRSDGKGVDWQTVPGCEISGGDFEKFRLRDGDFVFARSGSIEKAWCVARTPDAVFASYLIRARPSDESLSPFIVHYLRSMDYLAQIGAAGAGIGMVNVNASKLAELHIPIAPLPEQKRIVARLDALQARSRAAREALSEVPALLDTMRQSLLAAAFRGDLTAEWRAKNPDVEPASKLLERIRAERKRRWEQANPKKKYVEPEPVDDSELPELPDGWCWASFETLVDGVRSGTPRTAVREDTGFRVLRSSAVRPGVVDFDDYSFLPTAPSAEEVVMVGDLLVTRLSGTLAYVGNGALVRTAPSPPMAYPDRIFRSRPVDPRVGQWIEHALGVALLRRGLERTAKSSAGHQRISQGDLLEFPVPLPPIEEQREVQRVLPQALSMVSGLLSALSSAQADLDTLDQSILARAFRGELVDQDPNDEPAEVLLARIRSEGDATASRGRARRSG